ncbi:uncharacterized protein LOC141865801 [Acropora palmata]|uniref:uncharacterized protein LOC141865801 n=1 Tax=Acropora palmata TaxID=6131 RepID=UPI003DA17709
MGNTQVNVNATISNSSNSSDGTITDIPITQPLFTSEDIQKQVIAVACIGSLSFVSNLFLMILTSIRVREASYLFVQNFMVIDIINAPITFGLWIADLKTDSLALRVLTSFCQLAGFVNNTLATVFLGTVGAIAVSCFLLIVSPRGYSMFFVNKPIVRLLLFTIWFGAGFLASAPLNQGIWGAYALLQGTCWLSWQPGNATTYSAFHTIITLGPAIVFTVLAIVFAVRKKNNNVHPGPAQPATIHQPRLPPGNTKRGRNRACLQKFEVLYISCALLILYLAFWTPVSILQSLHVVHWSNVNYKTVAVVTLLYQSRGLLHLFIYFFFSTEIRRAFTKCKTTNLPETFPAEVRVPGQ